MFGLLFKAAMADQQRFGALPLKLSYQLVLEELSRWAERRHHQLKRTLKQMGCELLLSRKQGSTYVVQVRVRGYQREAIYSIELLRAECQQQLNLWAKQREEVHYEP
nr:hypothetical protein [Brevibacillus fulvus]